jgi:hypothetical protein
VAGKFLDQAFELLSSEEGFVSRDLGFALNMRITLASLILLTAISACGGNQPQQEQAAAPPPAAPAPEPPKAPYYVYVTNEIGGDLTVIDGGTNQVVATIP